MRRTKIPRKVCLEKVSSVHLEFFFSADRREEFPRFKCNFQVMSGLELFLILWIHLRMLLGRIVRLARDYGIMIVVSR